MSRILIISDSHFLRKNELKAFINSIGNIDATIHCGDIYIGYQENDFNNFYICRGNNDFSDIPRLNHFTIDNMHFVITHGHLHNYAYNPLSLEELREDYKADVICFGHTHVPFLYDENNLFIINPGSLVLGRTFPRVNTYAIFDTNSRNVQFYNAKTREKIEVKKTGPHTKM